VQGFFKRAGLRVEEGPGLGVACFFGGGDVSLWCVVRWGCGGGDGPWSIRILSFRRGVLGLEESSFGSDSVDILWAVLRWKRRRMMDWRLRYWVVGRCEVIFISPFGIRSGL
jgi:hypothetical protein